MPERSHPRPTEQIRTNSAYKKHTEDRGTDTKKDTISTATSLETLKQIIGQGKEISGNQSSETLDPTTTTQATDQNATRVATPETED